MTKRIPVISNPAQLMKCLIATQAPSPSRCCRGRSCSEMSTTSTRICPSGRADPRRGASRLSKSDLHSHLASPFLCASGYRTASSYSAGGKCTTPNRSSTVSKEEVHCGTWRCFLRPCFALHYVASPKGTRVNNSSLDKQNNNMTRHQHACSFSVDPKAETRLYVTVNGFEFHVYNRTDLYSRLQETFGLEPTLITPKRDDEREQEERQQTLGRFE